MIRKSLPDLREWYGFKSKEYKMDAENPEVMAFNKDFANELIRRSEQSIISETAPKFVLLELSGDGKTHAMNYALNQLQKRKLIDKIYFICPSMTSGSGYSVLHSSIISHMHEKNLIMPILKKIFKGCATSDTEQTIDNLKKKFKYDNIAKAVYSYFTENASEPQFIEYLMGHKMDKTARTNLDVYDSLNVEDSIRILEVISRLHYETTDKMITIVIDEANELKTVRQHVREFKEAFRRIAELPHFGLVIIYNIATRDDLKFDTLPTGLKDPGVVSRIGSANYMFKPRPMRPQDVKILIEETNKIMRGDKFADAFKKAKKENPKLEETAYPFTPDAVDEIVSKINEYFAKKKGVYILPRDVIRFAKDCLTRSALDGNLSVNKEFIKKRTYDQSFSTL